MLLLFIFRGMWLALQSDCNFCHHLIECIDLCIKQDEGKLNYVLLSLKLPLWFLVVGIKGSWRVIALGGWWGSGASVMKWKEILNNDDQTFICLSSCTTEGDTHVSGKKDAPQDIFLSDERRRKGSPKIGSSVIIYFLSCLLKPVWLSLFCETQKEKLLL